jgi:hypothetical protein
MKRINENLNIENSIHHQVSEPIIGKVLALPKSNMTEAHRAQLRDPPPARVRLPGGSKAKAHDVDGADSSPRRSALSNKNSTFAIPFRSSCGLTLSPISKYFQNRHP